MIWVGYDRVEQIYKTLKSERADLDGRALSEVKPAIPKSNPDSIWNSGLDADGEPVRHIVTSEHSPHSLPPLCGQAIAQAVGCSEQAIVAITVRAEYTAGKECDMDIEFGVSYIPELATWEEGEGFSSPKN